jgi:2,4-dienoyl-CoA reductase-like NADH-dependent reductase (Old Yellow Enzyme family)
VEHGERAPFLAPASTTSGCRSSWARPTPRGGAPPPPPTLYAEANIIGDRHIAFYRERARGGIAVIISEQHAAHATGRGGFRACCSAWDPRAVPQFAKLADAVHEFGALQFVQLWAPGLEDTGALIVDDWHPAVGQSRIRTLRRNTTPVVLDRAGIAEIVASFATSARNVRDGGLDGVEIHGAHGWLVGQFLSPLYNRRGDAYGGSTANRCRFALEIAEAIRTATGGELAVGIQLSVDEYLGELGITPEDTYAQLELLSRSGLFDYFNLSTGSPQASGHYTIASMEMPEAFLAEHARRAKEIVGERAKIMLVDRIRDVRTAARLVADGATDMVAMARAQLADPFLVQKAQQGRLDEIVPCVGENHCLGRVYGNLELTCMMNPATGRERAWGEGTLGNAAAPRRVVVLGGGPAGLKAAAVAASRGHAVVLFEARGELGGHLDLLARLPGRGDWRLAIDHLAAAARRARVELRLDQRPTLAELAAREPDVVLCATGSSWDRSGFTIARPGRATIPGLESGNVLDLGAALRTALDDPRALGPRVLIVDESDGYFAIGLADLLAAAEVEIELVTRQAVVGETVRLAADGHKAFGRLIAAGAGLTAQHLVEAIDGDRIELSHVWTGEPRRIEGVTSVVLAMDRIPDDGPFHEFEPSFPHVERIGDALAPRSAAEAIYEAERVARSL